MTTKFLALTTKFRALTTKFCLLTKKFLAFTTEIRWFFRGAGAGEAPFRGGEEGQRLHRRQTAGKIKILKKRFLVLAITRQKNSYLAVSCKEGKN